MLPLAPSGRLHVVLQRSSEDVHEPEYASDVPLVRFVAYSRDQRIYGWVRLQADRLSDLLNGYEELALDDVEIEDLAAGTTVSVDEIVVRCADLIAVHASGPRGDESRRRPTETLPVAMRAGRYVIGGHLHAPTGSDPIATLEDGRRMVPLTEGWIESWSGDAHAELWSGTVIVNREQADWLRAVTDRELRERRIGPAPAPEPAA